MISMLRGTIVEKDAPNLYIDVCGVCYEVTLSINSFYKLPDVGAETTIFTHLIIKEDSHALFGFCDKFERELFRALIKANGIGPKTAISILSGTTPNEFISFVKNNDVLSITHLPGIGSKTAEKLIIELRKFCNSINLTQGNTSIQDAINALVSLGYKQQDAQKAVSTHSKNSNLSCEELIRLALHDFRK